MRVPARFTEQKSKAPRKEKAASRSLGPKWERHRKELPDQFSGLEESGRERDGVTFHLRPSPPQLPPKVEQEKQNSPELGGDRWEGSGRPWPQN